MKPTQEQIEAALRYADSEETTGGMRTRMTLRDLAAAYREAMAENERLQGKLMVSNFVAAIPPHEIICTRCGLREERGEKPSCDF
jgi:hypothetical protein